MADDQFVMYIKENKKNCSEYILKINYESWANT